MALHPPSVHPKTFLKALSRLIEDETIIRPNDTYLGNMGSDTDLFFQNITLHFPNHVCLRAANLLQRSPNRGIRFSALLYVRRIATPGRWFLLNRLKTITLLHLKQIILFSLYSTHDTDVQMQGVLMKTAIEVARPDLPSKLWAMLGQAQDRDWSDSGDDEPVADGPSGPVADGSSEPGDDEPVADGSSEPVPERTFSVSDKLAEIALIALATELVRNLGSTALGLKTKEGVVLAVEKRIASPLLEPSSVEKIMQIDDHIRCAMSGLIADAHKLVKHARVKTKNHRFSYGIPMTVESTTQALALRFGEGDEESMSRPFGVTLLVAGHDENGPSLYYTDPSGTFWQCNAKAIGSGSERADSSLQEQYNKDITLEEAETITLTILKQVIEEKVTPNNVDIAKVAPIYHLYTPSEVEAVISRL
ncbi:hypothetical protein RHGRI_033351 [Rhododendron griersonianum]|uniref:Uncharacterized protein n=1 Tax=Rhododendron griersonianum TaxID=479676 RepID=A0AAV6I0M3_9ERIC|nr:hypothetical protein RHGRI_033351 [Rhododendron griersonianum]